MEINSAGKEINLPAKTFSTKIALAISSGDPGGIGPEIITDSLIKLMKEKKSFNKNSVSWDFIPVVIGDILFYKKLIKKFQNSLKIIKGDLIHEKLNILKILLQSSNGFFFDMGHSFAKIVIGRENRENSIAAYEYFKLAFNLVQSGTVHGLVTGPVNKGSLNNAGIAFTGHTDEFNKLSIKENRLFDEPFMLMYHKDIRVLLLTTHIPVSEVEKHLDIKKAKKAIRAAIKFFEIGNNKTPRIALLGVDPHCGDQKTIGKIDHQFSFPLISALREENVLIDGPFSADSFFTRANIKRFSLIVSPYHDQGLIPFKINCFGQGVNVTLNIPIKRTSPDHGTAYEIAGKNKANSNSMLKAISLCNKWVKS